VNVIPGRVDDSADTSSGTFCPVITHLIWLAAHEAAKMWMSVIAYWAGHRP